MKNITAFFILIHIIMIPVACTNSGETASEENADKQEMQPVSTAPEPKTVSGLSDTLSGTEKTAFSLDYLMGKFDPAKHPDFVKVDAKYTDGDTYYLRKEAYDGFVGMWNAAKADGVDLKIISATRNFYRQKAIWEAKWTGSRKIENGADASEKYPEPETRALRILKYSSMPGTSRHHWGTDIDINDLENDYFESGKGKVEYDWMTAHAAEFGFCQPYTPKGNTRPDGYEEEKWHWSYMPVARQLTELAATKLEDEMISGFKGAETATRIGVVDKYVLGISPACGK